MLPVVPIKAEKVKLSECMSELWSVKAKKKKNKVYGARELKIPCDIEISDYRGLRSLNQIIKQANCKFKEKKNLVGKICGESEVLPGYVCQDPALDLIPASQ